LKIRDVEKLKRFLRRSPKLFSKTECKNDLKHEGYTAAGMGGSLRPRATALRCRASVFRFRNF